LLVNHSDVNKATTRADKSLLFYHFLGFRFFKGFFFGFKVFLGFNSGHKITTHNQRFGHVNATNRSSYLNIICIKLVTQVKKAIKK